MVNINKLQSRRLIDRFHFPPDRVFTIGTGLDPAFFRHRSPEVTARCRTAMSTVLGGDPVISATPVERFLGEIEDWMTDQRPVWFSVETHPPGNPASMATFSSVHKAKTWSPAGRRRSPWPRSLSVCRRRLARLRR